MPAVINPFTPEDYEAVHNKLNDARELMLKAPMSREVSIVVTKIEEALLWYATIPSPAEAVQDA